MFLLGVILTSLAILFLLTSLALNADGRLRHPLRVAAKSALWLLTSAVPAWRSMLMVVGVRPLTRDK